MKANTKSAFKINVFNARCVGVFRKICQGLVKYIFGFSRLKRNKALDRLRSSVLDFGGNHREMFSICHLVHSRPFLYLLSTIYFFFFLYRSHVYSSLMFVHKCNYACIYIVQRRSRVLCALCKEL